MSAPTPAQLRLTEAAVSVARVAAELAHGAEHQPDGTWRIDTDDMQALTSALGTWTRSGEDFVTEIRGGRPTVDPVTPPRREVPSDLLFLLENTRAVAGESAAARESWHNLLLPYVGREEAHRLIRAALDGRRA